MSALERLYAALEPLRLYALRTGGLVDSELRACAAGFEMIRARAEALEALAFVQTAAGRQLDTYEALLGSPSRRDLDDGSRRALLLHRLGGMPFDSCREGIARSLRAVGLEADVAENPAGETLTVTCRQLLDTGLDRERLTRRVESVMPAHLEYTLDWEEG